MLKAAAEAFNAGDEASASEYARIVASLEQPKVPAVAAQVSEFAEDNSETASGQLANEASVSVDQQGYPRFTLKDDGGLLMVGWQNSPPKEYFQSVTAGEFKRIVTAIGKAASGVPRTFTFEEVEAHVPRLPHRIPDYKTRLVLRFLVFKGTIEKMNKGTYAITGRLSRFAEACNNGSDRLGGMLNPSWASVAGED